MLRRQGNDVSLQVLRNEGQIRVAAVYSVNRPDRSRQGNARTQAEAAIAWGRLRTMFPVRYAAIPGSISERARAQSPLKRCRQLAARWAMPTWYA